MSDEHITPGDVAPAAGAVVAPGTGTQWFGHPRGLATLFFTEMWERFSYYGMRALLILFMTAPLAAANAGLEFGAGKAAAIYGLYTSLVYLLALPGGWVADELWGQKKAVFRGGCIIAAGHFSMAVPTMGTFYLGLLLIVIGTGLLKPNVSTIVGDLYPEGGARRDAGFSIFYMGINVGALAGTALCGLIGEQYNFHWGFSLAGFGMVLGLIQYKLGAHHLEGAGDLKIDDSAQVLATRARNFYLASAGLAAVATAVAFLVTSGTLTIQLVATWLGYSIVLLVILFFTYLIYNWKWSAAALAVYAVLAVILVNVQGQEVGMRNTALLTLGLFLVVNCVYLVVAGEKVSITSKRLMVIFWLFLLAAVFWSGFEQAGSSMNLFARDLTKRTYGGWEMPASWLQNVNPLLIIIFAPIFGWLWTYLARKNANPSIPVKFALGLMGLAAGFFVLAWGAANATPETPVSGSWLVVTYFLHTCGELCLSPVGLSSITKLAPPDRVGQMMGIWFIGAALGNLFAGLVAGQLEDLPPNQLFWNVAIIIGLAGVAALLVSPFVKRVMGNVD